MWVSESLDISPSGSIAEYLNHIMNPIFLYFHYSPGKRMLSDGKGVVTWQGYTIIAGILGAN